MAAASRQPARTFLVEHYWPGVTIDVFRAAEGRVRESARQLAVSGARIWYRHSTFVPEDEAAYCVLDADSVELVELAYQHAGVAFERVVAAVDSGRTLPGRARRPDNHAERGREVVRNGKSS
jgi:hypothetical protein